MNKFTILGCGSSLGSPWITNYWGKCNPKNPKNLRTRSAAHIQFGKMSILIDTSPDIKEQFKKNKILNVDAVIYSHEHADQTAGIFELRPFFWKNKKKIPIYGNLRTIKALKKTYSYCFKTNQGYKPILKSYVVKKEFKFTNSKKILKFKSFPVKHGMITSNVYVFNKIAYISDCNFISNLYLKHFKNLDYLIIDALRYNKHPSHFSVDEAINFSNKLKPKKTILTNLHTDLDYSKLRKSLPKNIIPAYDGLSFNF